VFEDPVVEKIIRILMNKPKGPITAEDMLMVNDFTTSFPDDISPEGKIKTIDDLRWCPNLRSVLLLSEPDIKNINALSGTRELTEFQCVTILDDYTPLFANKKLHKIYLRGATDGPFRKLMANCSQLEDINLIHSEISPESIRMLAKNFKLSNLTLNDCGITDVSPFAGFKNLACLNLGFNQIKDLSPLAGNHKLSFKMFLNSNQISDWSPLEGMTLLAHLYVPNNPVTESPALDKLEKNGCKVYYR
jgi:Leucine-rich repeat (LRR) protein